MENFINLFEYLDVFNWFDFNEVGIAEVVFMSIITALLIRTTFIILIFFVEETGARKRCRKAGFYYGQRVKVRLTYDNWRDTIAGIVVDARPFCDKTWMIIYKCKDDHKDIRQAGDWLVS